MSGAIDRKVRPLRYPPCVRDRRRRSLPPHCLSLTFYDLVLDAIAAVSGSTVQIADVFPISTPSRLPNEQKISFPIVVLTKNAAAADPWLPMGFCRVTRHQRSERNKHDESWFPRDITPEKWEPEKLIRLSSLYIIYPVPEQPSSARPPVYTVEPL